MKLLTTKKYTILFYTYVKGQTHIHICKCIHTYYIYLYVIYSCILIPKKDKQTIMYIFTGSLLWVYDDLPYFYQVGKIFG